MTRKEYLAGLHLPSLHIRTDKYGTDAQKIFRTDGLSPAFPVPLPEDYGCGIRKDIRGTAFISCPADRFRLLVLETARFDGNPHHYGKITISGIRWKNENGDSVSLQDNSLQECWEETRIELTRFLTEKELRNTSRWNGYGKDTRTAAFLSYGELLSTARWFAASCIQGPLALYENDPKNPDSILLLGIDEEEKIHLG